jgi:predicted transcriptional regulator
MTTTTIRISKPMRDLLQQLAQATGVSMQMVLEQALESYRRQQLLAATNAAYGALRTNADTWNQLEEERLVWEQTLTDGLEEL